MIGTTTFFHGRLAAKLGLSLLSSGCPSCLFRTTCHYIVVLRGSLGYAGRNSVTIEDCQMSVNRVFCSLIRNILADRAELVTENIALH